MAVLLDMLLPRLRRLQLATLPRNSAYYNAAMHPRDSHGRWASTDHLNTATEFYHLDRYIKEVVRPQSIVVQNQHGAASRLAREFDKTFRWGGLQGRDALENHREALAHHLQELANVATPEEDYRLQLALRENLQDINRVSAAGDLAEREQLLHERKILRFYSTQVERVLADRPNAVLPDPTMDDHTRAIFGRAMPATEWGKLFGVDAKHITLTDSSTPLHPIVTVEIDDPRMEAKIHFEHLGTRTIAAVDWVENKGPRTAASGREMLHIMHAFRDLGVTSVHAVAARGADMNGYYTWARMGFVGDIPSHYGVLAAAQARFGPDITRVEHLMQTREGRSWWKEHGQDFNASFDFRDGSYSRQVFDRLSRDLGAQRLQTMRLRIADLHRLVGCTHYLRGYHGYFAGCADGGSGSGHLPVGGLVHDRYKKDAGMRQLLGLKGEIDLHELRLSWLNYQHAHRGEDLTEASAAYQKRRRAIEKRADKGAKALTDDEVRLLIRHGAQLEQHADREADLWKSRAMREQAHLLQRHLERAAMLRESTPKAAGAEAPKAPRGRRARRIVQSDLLRLRLEVLRLRIPTIKRDWNSSFIWDETKHPRGAHGRFIGGAGATVLPLPHEIPFLQGAIWEAQRQANRAAEQAGGKHTAAGRAAWRAYNETVALGPHQGLPAIQAHLAEIKTQLATTARNLTPTEASELRALLHTYDDRLHARFDAPNYAQGDERSRLWIDRDRIEQVLKAYNREQARMARAAGRRAADAPKVSFTEIAGKRAWAALSQADQHRITAQLDAQNEPYRLAHEQEEARQRQQREEWARQAAARDEAARQEFERLNADRIRYAATIPPDQAFPLNRRAANQALFGRQVSNAEWQQIFGVSANAKVDVRTLPAFFGMNNQQQIGYHLEVQIREPGESSIDFHVSPGTHLITLPNGKLSLGAAISVGTAYRNLSERNAIAGLGMLKTMQALQALGVQQLDATAGGSGTARGGRGFGGGNYNGYYTWARLGFTGDIPPNILSDVWDQFGTQVTRVEQVMAEPGGPQWWKKYGESWHATFDFTPGSLSMQALDRWLAALADHQRMQIALLQERATLLRYTMNTIKFLFQEVA